MANAITYSGRSILFNRLKGSGTEPKNIGWGVGVATGSANSDVNMFIPGTEARTAGTSTVLTTTQLADTYQVVGTITATGTRAITEAALFDSTTLSPQTTVTGSMTNSVTGSIVVAATGAFPSASLGYYVQIDNEVLNVNTIDATHINVITRGVNGSAATTHSAGAVIVLGGDGGAGAAGATSLQTAAISGGAMFAHADFSVINLLINDSIAFTFKDQLT